MKESEYRLLKFFKALSNVVRFDILRLLLDTELSTYELSDRLNRNESNISQHLKILKNLDIVKYHTDGKNVVYSLKRKDLVLKIFELEEMFLRE